MNTAIEPQIGAKAYEIMEAVIAKGELEQLTPKERGKLYGRVCESIGLNPFTRPFEYLKLSNRLVLYARKDATDQLRSIHGISVTEMTEREREGVFIVTAHVRNATGRTDAAIGAVSIAGKKGDDLANAMMKAETKAKRRATLSICDSDLSTNPRSKQSRAEIASPGTMTIRVPSAEEELKYVDVVPDLPETKQPEAERAGAT